MHVPIPYFFLGGSAEVRITFELVIGETIYIRKLEIMLVSVMLQK
jgi:hypothetical protein